MSLNDATSPYLLRTRTIRSSGGSGARKRWPRPRRQDKPILLSLGYTGCHWCHVMNRESFSDPEIAGPDQRQFHPHPGRPRRAARPGHALSGRRRHHGPSGRLAAQHLPHPRWRALLGRRLSAARGKAGQCPASAASSRETAELWKNDRPRAEDTGRQGARQRWRISTTAT